MREIGLGIVAAAIAAAAAWSVMVGMAAAAPGLPATLIAAPVAAAVYALSLALVGHRTFREICQTLFARRRHG